MMQYWIEDPEAWEKHMPNILKDIQHPIILLSGNLGAGKTSFVRHFLKFGYDFSEVSSPTFSLVNEYHTDRSIIYHMDLYRIKSEDEAEEAGILEYLDTGNTVLIEWPEIIISILKSMPRCHLYFNEKNGGRELRIQNFN